MALCLTLSLALTSSLIGSLCLRNIQWLWHDFILLSCTPASSHVLPARNAFNQICVTFPTAYMSWQARNTTRLPQVRKRTKLCLVWRIPWALIEERWGACQSTWQILGMSASRFFDFRWHHCNQRWPKKYVTYAFTMIDMPTKCHLTKWYWL